MKTIILLTLLLLTSCNTPDTLRAQITRDNTDDEYRGCLRHCAENPRACARIVAEEYCEGLIK